MAFKTAALSSIRASVPTASGHVSSMRPPIKPFDPKTRIFIRFLALFLHLARTLKQAPCQPFTLRAASTSSHCFYTTPPSRLNLVQMSFLVPIRARVSLYSNQSHSDDHVLFDLPRT